MSRNKHPRINQYKIDNENFLVYVHYIGHHIDLMAANEYLLQQEEIPEENIFVSGICTFEDDSLFSARREGVNCGRNITSIMLI